MKAKVLLVAAVVVALGTTVFALVYQSNIQLAQPVALGGAGMALLLVVTGMAMHGAQGSASERLDQSN